MIITAALCFFDEQPELLAKCIALLGSVGVDRLVAVDGPYALYPHEATRSSPEAIESIRAVTKTAGIDLTLVQTDRAWAGNEVGKRQRMLEIAKDPLSRYAGRWQRDRAERNWLLVVDADHFWQSDVDLHRALESTTQDFARVSFAEVFEPNGTPIYAPAIPLMRARRDLRMGANHYTYLVDSGFSSEPQFSTFLERPTPTVRVLDLTDRVRVIHGVHDRDSAKRDRQTAYYRERDTKGVEA